jgi:hypothetical protein
MRQEPKRQNKRKEEKKMITMREADFERFNAIELYAMDEAHTFEECVEYAESLGVVFTSADMQRIAWDMDEA